MLQVAQNARVLSVMRGFCYYPQYEQIIQAHAENAFLATEGIQVAAIMSFFVSTAIGIKSLLKVWGAGCVYGIIDSVFDFKKTDLATLSIAIPNMMIMIGGLINLEYSKLRVFITGGTAGIGVASGVYMCNGTTTYILRKKIKDPQNTENRTK